MTDCCQDKTSPYEIRPEESALFDAAIVFGDWLADFPLANREEIAAIREMQTFLRNLPSAPPPNFNAEYGFRIETSNEEAGGISHVGREAHRLVNFNDYQALSRGIELS